MLPWWIVVTNTSCEKRAAAGLRERGFEVWFPTRMVRFKSRYMKRPAERAYPQFPSYLFVRSSGLRPTFRYGRIDGHLCKVDLGTERHQHDWREVFGVDGVRSILANDYRPSLFKDEDVAPLRAHLDDIASKVIDMAIWRTDDRARVTDGPFTGFTVTVASSEQRGSISVLMSFFGRRSVVEMSVDQLARVA